MFGDPGRQFEAIDQLGRGDHTIAGLTAKFLNARRGVDGVAEKNDLPFDRAHLAGHHRTAMKSSSDSDGRPEFTAAIGRRSAQLVDGAEAGRDAAAIGDSLLELPGRDQFIADVAMDFARAATIGCVRSSIKRLTKRWEAEHDDAEVDEGLYHHMRRKGRSAKRGAQGRVQHERIERRQNACNQAAGQSAARGSCREA